MLNILILDDDIVLNNIFNRVLSAENNVTSAYSFEEAVRAINEEVYDIIISDIKLPSGSGLEFLKIAKTILPESYVIMVTGYVDVEDAIEAMKSGAVDYLIKPIDNFQLLSKINFLQENITLKNINNQSTKDIELKSESYSKTIAMAEKVAKSDCNILITGETGVGKGVLARHIHKLSLRHSKPFLSINCSNFQEHLFESELFGYKKGAFTSANQNKSGIVSIAEKGTLLFDEIGEVPQNFQSKLLKFFDDKSYIPLGSTTVIKADIRLIFATNRNLATMVSNNEFREDLFYRLNIINIEIPPLRKRKEDIIPLTYHFIERNKQINYKIKDIADDAKELLLNYNYPGNIRELSNIIERALILEDSDMLTNLSINIDDKKNDENNKTLFAIEKFHIVSILTENANDKNKAAEILGIDRSTLYRKLKEYDIK